MYELYFDGYMGKSGGGAGAIIFRDGVEVCSSSMYVDEGSNNVAEYNGLILGLNHAIHANIKDIVVKGNMVRSKNENLEYYRNVKKLEEHFDKIVYEDTMDNKATRLAMLGIRKKSLDTNG